MSLCANRTKEVEEEKCSFFVQFVSNGDPCKKLCPRSIVVVNLIFEVTQRPDLLVGVMISQLEAPVSSFIDVVVQLEPPGPIQVHMLLNLDHLGLWVW